MRAGHGEVGLASGWGVHCRHCECADFLKCRLHHNLCTLYHVAPSLSSVARFFGALDVGPVTI
jgi:hypothetical protein